MEWPAWPTTSVVTENSSKATHYQMVSYPLEGKVIFWSFDYGLIISFFSTKESRY